MNNEFSIEAVILGRNDDYEPGWLAKLCSSIAYNRRLFEGSGINFCVAFVEWNPPRQKSLIAPILIEKFPFVRAVVVDADVHDALCTADDLSMMLNFSLNSALRTSIADYLLITGGDLFYGRDLAEHIRSNRLRKKCLYRAERVNIREDLDYSFPRPEVIEDPANIVSVNTCTEPPYNVPPYTHACGDFLMVDRVTMVGLRGFDESIHFARLHLDSRFSLTAMAAGLDCELLGRIYHINHRKSLTNFIGNYPGRDYDYNANLPYVNPVTWGLADHVWTRVEDQLWQVSRPEPSSIPVIPNSIPATLSLEEIGAADQVTHALLDARAKIQPMQPYPRLPIASQAIKIDATKTYSYWIDALVTRTDSGPIEIQTGASDWSYAALLPLPCFDASEDHWFWVSVEAQALSGQVGVCILVGDDVVSENYFVARDGKQQQILILPAGATKLIFRNAANGNIASSLMLYAVNLISQKRYSEPQEPFLLTFTF